MFSNNIVDLLYWYDRFTEKYIYKLTNFDVGLCLEVACNNSVLWSAFIQPARSARPTRNILNIQKERLWPIYSKINRNNGNMNVAW